MGVKLVPGITRQSCGDGLKPGQDVSTACGWGAGSDGPMAGQGQAATWQEV